MSTEVSILRKINFEDLVTQFSKKKEWKVSLLWNVFTSNTVCLYWDY